MSEPKDGVRSVWLRPRRTRKGEPPLTLARIVEAAVALLDEEGIDRLTMRRLAERLAVVAPSLYWHVDTKDDVIDLAVDAIFGEVPPGTAPGGGWREDVASVLAAWRAALLRHPWAAAVPARQRPTIGPNFLAWMEILQSTLARAGFSGKGLAAATWALYNHVMGSASTEAALRITDAERDLGQRQLRADGRYPTLAANGYLYDDDWDGSFSTGLDYLLDGLQAQLAATQGSGPR
ncbi:MULTISPECIES: TetR/AcrR family transcriptional regulator C-terminal domain-containing protein [Actinomadura]|uniref:TetR family transcriptional regulator n=1 Tax=Actinomadura litoris TaxID=2678616 RepID=A0A7K1L8G1_9ACTN|nr:MULTISPECIES: TetR/AcrR family transcriptional regulator C-terminal domain-containing protein [Actinomadura]MBT2213043.1 TetR/AcrR family transcriptional regulator C-terminal domain-containing protein [Actinomadura sp. NEAU-AAG7]MUN40724.1 TetR family transcriptional regulator [Actinomadura litoris]